MPRYDFLCPKCKQTFEAIVPVEMTKLRCYFCATDQSLIIKDDEPQAERQLSAPSCIHIH